MRTGRYKDMVMVINISVLEHPKITFCGRIHYILKCVVLNELGLEIKTVFIKVEKVRLKIQFWNLNCCYSTTLLSFGSFKDVAPKIT